MELSRQMLLLTAVNYGSYYLHITYLPKREDLIAEIEQQKEFFELQEKEKNKK